MVGPPYRVCYSMFGSRNGTDSVAYIEQIWPTEGDGEVLVGPMPERRQPQRRKN